MYKNRPGFSQNRAGFLMPTGTGVKHARTPTLRPDHRCATPLGETLQERCGDRRQDGRHGHRADHAADDATRSENGHERGGDPATWRRRGAEPRSARDSRKAARRARRSRRIADPRRSPPGAMRVTPRQGPRGDACEPRPEATAVIRRAAPCAGPTVGTIRGIPKRVVR